MTGYIGFIPCRAGSERVPNKNTRPFAGFEGGLLELKLRQLAGVSKLEKIVVSSNDPIVLDYVASFSPHVDILIEAINRPNELGTSSTPMDDFIRYTGNLSEEGTIVFTHVTSPFICAREYESIISAYEKSLNEGYDSLLTVTKLHKFLWDEKGPINYTPHPIKWPRSQDIRPIFEINHGAYVLPFKLMRETGDRLGHRPYFMPLSEIVAMDIDWEEQFELLEQIALAKMSKGAVLI
ncbi:cytidylyltransferase domain-containing protein [Asticcacaulis tiandongensis]|uniref:acylneuraminate cytidylyltransferase family protein n=1 Tax=Asticcacaulis tiandongensis TaxID=2565365 RepID=UPI001127AD5F|nr:acylneuraminate cytidylyltransferase family protein [Asticcacaulis tiandongensis]